MPFFTDGSHSADKAVHHSSPNVKIEEKPSFKIVLIL
jgi:hypothetical protein